VCGIAGFFSYDLPLKKSELESMTDSLSHRGPNAGGYFHDETNNFNAGLGHRRLSILDLSEAANQPMYSHNNRYVIVFNGEVYNFKEISEKYKLQCKTTSDTEVILEAFALLGPAFVKELNGMFAFVIYDRQEKKMYLFRDRIGVKPIYYYYDGTNFAFASEIKALTHLHCLRAKTGLRKEAIAYFLHLGYIPQPDTIYTNIYKFPSGHYGVFEQQKLSLTQYWSAAEKIKPELTTDLTTAKKQLEELLTSSVQYRLISDVPVGVFLSGGIDSSLVTSIAQKVSNTPVKSFSIGFKEDGFREHEYSSKIAKHLGTDHHEFILSSQDCRNVLEEVIDSFDEPYADSSAIPTYLLSREARKKVTVALSGDGGDELFMGYGAYTWASRLSSPLIHYNRQLLRTGLSLLGNDKYKRVAHLFDYKSRQRIKSHIFSQEQYFFSENELEKLLHKELVFSAEKINTLPPVNRRLSAAEEQALFDLSYYLRDDLMTKMDISSMRSSLEAREPLLDYRIVEFSLNLSESLKVHDGATKFLLKEILYSYVPKEYYNRPKTGFSIPLKLWLKNDLSYMLEEYLSEQCVKSVGIFNYEYVNQLVKRYLAGETYLYHRVWLILVLQRWMIKNGMNLG